MTMARFEWGLNVDLQWISCLLWDHLAVDKWILDAWVVLDEPVLTELEVKIFEFIQCEGVVISTIKIAHFRLLLCDLCSWPCAWVHICRLESELWRMHVILFPP